VHCLILGITETGKTTLGFRLAAAYRQQGINVLVLDPDLRSEWCANYITDDPEDFLKFVKINTKCALFVDESGQMIGRYTTPMEWLATNSRKWGHKAHFLAQRATQLPPIVRAQCTTIFLFKQAMTDAKILAADFVAEDLKQSCFLVKGEYLVKVGVDGQVKRGKLW
jgi:hypothetical protein